MKLYRIPLQPRTAFATPLKGDTLFGQCCWAVRRLQGEAALVELLKDYLQGQPFLVLSDPLPVGFLRRPALPAYLLGLGAGDPKARKAAKGKRWLPESVLGQPVGTWGQAALNDGELAERLGFTQRDWPLFRHENRTHNSLNRLTGTTGAGEAGFAPYDRALTWHHPELRLEIYAALDEARCSLEGLCEALGYVGQQGYGKDASGGLGKFEVGTPVLAAPSRPERPDAWLTLAPCAPQGRVWDAERSYYEIFTRFGRHGDQAAHSGVPFKNPVLLADSFALLTPRAFDPAACYVGQGIGGVSRTVANAVQQGYAPVLGARWEESQP